jgi:hypothetical protein
MSIKRLAGWALLVAAAVAAGVLSVRPAMRAVLEASAVRSGPWSTVAGAGSAEANFYERAAIAIAGLYALSREETVYYTAFTDSEGRELDGRCDYTLAGRPPPSRWWSFTLYGADHYLVDNPAHVYSRHAGNLALESDGGFRIAVSPAPQPRNWLPAPASGGFSITARLYNPEPALLRDLAGAPLPTIERGACR